MSTGWNADIAEALAAFEASGSAKSPTGKLVARKLQEYRDSGEIGFDPLSPATYGVSYQNRWGDNVRVNSAYEGNVGATSLVLAHEGVHRITNTSSFDEEVACFEFQIMYYNELLAGVSYTSPATGTMAIAHTNASILGAPSETDKARKWHMNKQLVDFVLAKPIYQDKINAHWVKSHLTQWGGLKNRWATSRGVFVRALAANTDTANGSLILDILESIGTQADWDELLRVAGDFNNVRKLLRTARNASIAGRRMDGLSKRWKIDWKEK